jgi:hypothetical protein
MSFSTPSSSTAQCDSHLSFPTPDIPDDAVPSTSSSHRSPMLLKDRLYVGNLHPTIDELVNSFFNKCITHFNLDTRYSKYFRNLAK